MEFPKELNGAKVLYVAISKNDENFGYNYYVEDDSYEEIKNMAIVKYEDSDLLYLFSCDENWEVLSELVGESFGDFQNIQFEDEIIEIDWQKVSE